jgi:PAS domain S-box-containing protein
VIGVIAVANRTGGYDEGILAEIQPLLATYGSLIEARRSALRRRAAEESLQKLNASLETEVQRRAATFETLASLSPVGIVRMDADAQCLYVNQRYCEMLGITREAALGRGWTRTTLHPEDRERVLAEWRRSLELGQPFHCDCRFVRPDGQTISILAQTVPTIDARGTVAGYIGTLTDVTEQKLMEQALRVLSTELVALEGTAFFRRMVQQLATLLDCEIAVVAGTRKDDEEPMLQTLAVFEDGEFTADFTCSLSKSPWTEDTFDRPIVIPSGVRVPSPFLTSRNVEGFAAVPLLDHAGACIGQLAVMSRRSLVNPRRVEAILHVFAISATAQLEQQRSARRFHDLFEFSPDAIVMTDPSGVIRLVNRKAEAMFGWSRDELIGQHVEQLVPQEERARHVLQRQRFVAADLSPALPADRPHLQAIRKDGTVFPVEIGLGSIETGEGLMIAAAVRDITERRNAERQANRARRLESIGTLAGGIAHDLNNALTPILLTLDLLKQQYPGEHETLDTVEHSANHAAEMVRHLLAFAKGSEGKRVSLAPRRLLEETEKIIKGTFPKSIQVRIRTPKELPTVLGDATQLHQVLLNLCVNARDAMPEGGTLALEAEATDGSALADLPTATGERPPERCVVIRVADTGTGIAPEVLERIFDPFFTTKEPESGTGLGLFTVAGIVKGHGGLIRVSSQPGRGSTFAVLLPAEERHSTVEEKPEIPPSDFTGHGELILYIDDEATVRDAARSVLERLKFTPVTASDGMSGLVQAVQHRAGLYAVITDLHMPHMDGIAFVRALRKLLPNIPVIVASGRLEPAPAQELRKLGVQVMLEKPFTQEQLASALQSALRQGG